MNGLRLFLCSLTLLAMTSAAWSAENEFLAEQLEFFEKQVRPLLVEHCFECHAGEKVKGGLSLQSRAATLKGGDTGPAVVPGDLKSGELLAALEYDPLGYQMPPAGKLSDKQIAVFRRWVEMGAPWPHEEGDATVAREGFNLKERAAHWSFQPLLRPEVPSVAQPEWCRTPVDQFLRHRLEAVGLTPNEAADKQTWVRRVYFDVLGLPPSPEQIQSFLDDDLPGAEERLVDELLANPHFGERWGRHWLDLVRYAESRGHEFDYNVANAWHYRDYVIRALNDDIPYDQFVTEHVAGDMLPETEGEGPQLRIDPATGRNESIIGTGFWLLGEWVHSPVDIRKEESDRFDNMIDVYSKTFLGLTVACARCHDHKFDPILQKDFYALQGFLQSSSYRQVRFETMQEEQRIVEELQQLREDAAPVLMRTYAELVEPTANDVDKYILATQSVLAAGIELKPRANEIVFEDFESGTYDGWTVEGEAFGTGPVTLADLPDYQGKINGTGKFFVNSHLKRNGGRGDVHTGRLTSRPFSIEHRYIRFWIGGGGHAGKTCVNLVVDGAVARTNTGPSNNQMVLAEWDVAELKGKSAQIQVVDEGTSGWGNIGLDHVVFTNESMQAPSQLAAADLAPSMQRKLLAAAREYGVHMNVLKQWVIAYASAEAESPFADLRTLHARFASKETPSTAHRLDELLGSDAVEVVADFRNAEQLLTDGPVFATGQQNLGSPHFDISRDVLLTSIEDVGSVQRDRFWDAISFAPGTQGEPGATGDWQRGGRMLRTKSFTVSKPKLFALVRGGCRTYACVDSHILLNGPLHGALVRTHNPQADWHWIEHDVSRYQGHGAHLEFVPHDNDDFAVALVVQADSRAKLPTAAPQAKAGEVGVDELASAVRLSVERAVHFMYQDATVPRTDEAAIAWANWMLAHPKLLEMEDENLVRWNQLAEPFATKFAQLQSRAHLRSATTPALLAGTPEDEYVFVRGNWKKQGEPAPRSFLTVFDGSTTSDDQLASGEAKTRLELAWQMIDSRRTPILARVIVNRIWHHYFGRGIVPTPDDFGHLGQPPTHPEILDWLASELVDHNWSQKHIHRLILSSAAYRMSSAVQSNPNIAQVDPENSLLHRMNVKRLEGEVIRDAILSVSGRYDVAMYGESVPIHLNSFLEGRGRPASGPVDGTGRRSVYLSVRRNFAEPFFQAFDFPVPHTTVGRRSVSNVPAQALALMNNEMVIEQSSVWASKLLAEHTDTESRLTELYQQALGRKPAGAELQYAEEFLSEQSREYSTSPDDPRVWQDLCQAIWNSKEFIFIR
ncbi:MAG: PSD1 and planctomycete cytochrome C domain-containing protein [Planctomycetaceae bacterium]